MHCTHARGVHPDNVGIVRRGARSGIAYATLTLFNPGGTMQGRPASSDHYKELPERNIFEGRWTGSAGFTDYLNQRPVDHHAFLKRMGVLK